MEGSGMANEKRKNKENRGMMVGIGVLVVVLAIVAAVYVDTFYGEGKIKSTVTQLLQLEDAGTEAETGGSVYTLQNSMVIDESTKSAFVTFDKQFLLCTKDGVKYFSSMGDQAWNDTFNMSAPQLIKEGNYAAVGDMGAKAVRVYSKQGLAYSLQLEGALSQFALNENGYLSVIIKDDKNYRVQVYNANGTLLKGRVEESNGVYPLSSDVSDDNKVFAVSYLDTADIEPIARVLFFYIGQESAESFTDSLFAAVEKPDEIIPRIGYMKGGSLVAVSDKSVYGIVGDGTEAWAYGLQNSLSQVAIDGKSYVVLALGESAVNADGRPRGTVCILNPNGNETASYETGKEVTFLRTADSGIVVGTGSEYIGLKYNGKAEWSYRATSAVVDILPLNSLSKTLILMRDIAIVEDITTLTNARSAEDTVVQTTDTPENGGDGEAPENDASGDDTQEDSSTPDGGEANALDGADE